MLLCSNANVSRSGHSPTFPIDALRKSRNYRIMNVDLGSTNAVDKASATLGRVMTLRISARVSGFIRTRTQFVGRFCEMSETIKHIT